MRPAILAILVLACSVNLLGQNPLAIKWTTEKPVSESNNYLDFAKVAVDPETNILRVIQPDYSAAVTLSKFTLSGQLVFEKNWSLPQPTFSSFFSQTFSIDHEGNSILLIVENSFPPQEGVLHYVSYDRNGGLRWDKNERIPYDVNVPWFRAAAVDNQNNVIFAGSISNRLVAQKISPTGDLVWRYAFERPDVLYSWAHDVAVDAAGRAYVVGAGDTTTFRIPLCIAFDATGPVEFWNDPSARLELRTIRITENGAIYLTDDARIFRVNPNGQTEWSRFPEAGAPYIVAPMANEKVAILTAEGFNIWDQAGKALGSGRFTSPYAPQDIEGSGDSLFMSRGGRIFEARPDASLVSEISFEDVAVFDIVVTENLDLAFVGLRSATNGTFTFTGLLTHSTQTDIPRILEQPQGAIAVAGTDFTATVTASGSNLKYQWFYSPSPSSRSVLDGQTSSSLLLTNLQVYQSGNYYVEVSNSLGTISSAYANLAVHTIPKFTANPSTAPSRPYMGERVTWRYSASISSPSGRQWYKDGIPIPGATNLTYVIAAAGPSDLGKYSVLITNLVGEAKSEEVEFPKFLENVSMTIVTNEFKFSLGSLGKDTQHNVYFSGALYSSGKYIPTFAKFDKTGQLLWTTNIPGLAPILMQPNMVSTVAEDGSIYIPGTTNSTPVLCKIDSTGATAWTTSLKNELNMMFRVKTSQLHSYVAGLRTTTLKKAVVLVALNPDGTHSYTTPIEFTGVNDPWSWLEVTSDERIYLVARALKALCAFDSSGAILWTNSFSTNTIVDMKTGPDNSVYVLSQNGRFAACAKFNAAGEKLWTTFPRRPGQVNTEYNQLEVDTFGNAYITSSLTSSVTKINSDGHVESEWSAGIIQNRRQLRTTDSETVYILGYAADAPTMTKYDANGIRRWSRTMPGQFIDVGFIPVTDREVVFLTPNKWIKLQDLETPQMAQITARIERDIISTNPVLRVDVEGAAAQKLTWYLNGLPLGSAGGGLIVGSGESIAPKLTGSGSYYAVEIETEDAVLATADHFFDAFSIINDAQLTEGSLQLNLRAVSSSTFRLQRSHNLIDWEDYNTTTSDPDGQAQIIIPFNNQQQTEYFRAIK